jgi:hypothetical protein
LRGFERHGNVVSDGQCHWHLPNIFCRMHRRQLTRRSLIVTRCPPQPADSGNSEGDFVTSAGLPTGASDKRQRELLSLFTYRLLSMHCMAVDIATAER